MKKFLIIFGVVFVVLCSAFLGTFKYKNQPPKPDYYEYYKTQDSVPEGKIGIFVTGLVARPKHSAVFYYNVTKKVFGSIIPWPFRIFAKADKGVLLLDSERFFETEEFTPKRLEDMYGVDYDLDGVPYVEKYKKGEVVWVPPRNKKYDHGYFLYEARKGGLPTAAAKIINKSRIWYGEKGLLEKKNPQPSHVGQVMDKTFAELKSKYPELVFSWESSLYPHEMKTKLYELLDKGCDTIILGSTLSIYSHFEDFNSGFRHSFEFIHEWEKEHPEKKIKVIISPPSCGFQSMRNAFLEMLKDRLSVLPDGSDVQVALTIHGMPWDQMPYEAWNDFGPSYTGKLLNEVKALIKGFNFNRTDALICQFNFADDESDPKQKYLSANELYWQAIYAGYDYVVNLPIEFYAENTDSMLTFPMEQYENFEQYNVYEPISYPDWSVPYTREMVQGKTKVIYNGVPAGKYQKYVVDAFCQSFETVLSHHE
jgi:hypothetical protein